MKKLVFAALLCGGIAQLGTGCIIVSDDEEPPIEPVDDMGYINASWYLVSGDNEDPANCPEGATTIEVITQDGNGDQIIDQFDCIDGQGTISRYPGTYLTWVRLTDDSAVYDYAMSVSRDVVVEAGYEVPEDFTFSVDRGSFFFNWALLYAGESTDCASEDIGDVAVTSTLVGGNGTGYDDTAPCEDYQLTTGGMPLGDYVLSVALLDSANSGAIYYAEEIEDSLLYGNHFKDLGTIQLDAAGN